MTKFKTDVSKQGKQFELVFTTDNKEHFNKVQSVARDCIDHKPTTQFDRIKAMSVEELARFLAEHIDHYRAPYDVKEIYANAIDNKTGKGIIWIEAFKRWLESEVQGE